MNLSISQHKIIICLFGIMFSVMMHFGAANAEDIIFHEEEEMQATIYSVSSDGTGLEKIGQGLFPQWSPDKKIITYIEPAGDAGPTLKRGLVGIDSAGKKVFQIDRGKEIDFIVRYSWHPSGKTIAFVAVSDRHAGSIALFDTRTKQLKSLHQFRIKDLDVALLGTTLEWMPDGKKLLFSPGSVAPSGDGVALIDSDQGNVRNLSSTGMFPRIMGDKILYFVNSEIWSMNLDGSETKKILDTGLHMPSASKVAGGKMLLQGEAGKDHVLKLYLFDIPNDKLNEIKAKDYLLFCPVISPDGKKFTAIGIKVDKNTRAKMDDNTREDLEVGYYVYNLSNEKTTLLKRFKKEPEPEPFAFQIMFGYANHSSWYQK